MNLLKLSTAREAMILMVGTADHLTGLAGLTLTITASKDGAAFASITPTVTDRGSGWYSLALTTTHTNTLGDLALHITGTAADPSDPKFQVVTLLPGESVVVGSFAAGAITAAAFTAGAIDAAAIAADAIGSSELAASAVNEIADQVWDELIAGHAVSGSTGEALTNAGGAGTPPTAAVIADAVWDEILSGHATGGSGGKILTDAAAQSLLMTIAGYLDTEIAAIKAKTDNLPAAPAAVGDIPTVDDILTMDIASLAAAIKANPHCLGGVVTVLMRTWRIVSSLIEWQDEAGIYGGTNGLSRTITGTDAGADPISDNADIA